MIWTNESINLRLSGGKYFGTVLEYVDEVTLRLEVGTYMHSLYGYFDGYENTKLKGLLLGCLL